MRKQSIIWTALPHGASGNTLSLSVFIAPRLWDDTSNADRVLGDYDDFLHWPDRIGAATFSVSFNGGVPIQATPVAPPLLDENVWNALFNEFTRVTPFRFRSLLPAEIIAPSSTAILDTIKGVYQTFATDPAYRDGADLPPRDIVAKNRDLVDIAWPTRPRPNVQNVPDDRRPIPGPVWVPGRPEPEPTKPPEKKPGCGCAGCLAMPLALLRRLLKMLGMIATLPFTMGVGGVGGGATLNPKLATMKELYRAVGPTSETSEDMPTAAELAKRYDFHEMISTLGDYPVLLRMCGLVIDLTVTLDAPIPANGFVEVHPNTALDPTMTHNHRPRTHYELDGDQFIAASQPAGGDLRNGLLRVDDTNRFQIMELDIAGGGIKLQQMATAVVGRELNDEWAGNDPGEEGLPALQTAGLSIVRPGFAVHLRERFEASEAQNNALAAADGSTPGDPTIAPRMDFFAEDLVRGYRVDVWDDQSNAWHSLCQRVGKYEFEGFTLPPQTDEAFVQASAIEPVKEGARPVLRTHESLFTWNGWSLGAPRYGNTILPRSDETEVGPPPNDPATQFKLRATFTPPRGSLPRLRFGYEYRMRVRAADLAGNSVFAPGDAAFKATQLEVTDKVRYRRFEPVPPPMLMMQRKPVEGESLERLVVRTKVNDDDATIAAQLTARHIIPPKTSQLMAEIHRKFDVPGAMKRDENGYSLASREAGSITHFVKPDGTLEKIFDVEQLGTRNEDLWIQKEDTFAVSYLPDPYARGVLLLGLPGLAPEAIVNGVNRITFTGAWPDPEPFRLLVRGIRAGLNPAAPVWSPGDRLLTVEVPQGETYRVRINSIFKPADLDNMAVWKWIEETGVAHLPQLRARAEAGRNWLHLPFRTLVLVHAVQQPLDVPKITGVTTNRNKGETLAVFTAGTCKVDVKSTEKIDIFAAWKDPVDDPKLPEPTSVERNMHVDEVRADVASGVLQLKDVEHAVGDTKFHSVTYRVNATSAFREYYPEAIWQLPENITRPLPTEPDAEQPNVIVKNTARPDAPKLQYIVPAFTWTHTGMTHTRGAGGLRVYLDRPWYSSGDGELLGIVLRRAVTPAGSLPKYTSEWGMDPLWPAAATTPLSLNEFADPVAVGNDVSLAEIENELVDVVGYKPEFDKERRLWYCDIRMKTGGAYMPMIRLALVRFQPNSAPGAHVSQVVLANFIQTVPRRRVTYDTTQLALTGRVDVEVQGPAFVRSHSDPASTPRMIVRMERRSAIGATDELGWEPFASTIIPAVVPLLNPADVIWRGTIDAGSAPPSPLRVVVMEVEPYFTDGGSNVDQLNLLAGAVLPGLGLTKDDMTMGYRVTFADALEVP